MNQPITPIYSQFVIDKTLVTDIAKLQLEHGDVLLCRVKPETEDRDCQMLVKAMRSWMNQYGFGDVYILVHKGEDRIEHFREEEMAKLGWVRKSNFLKTVQR